MKAIVCTQYGSPDLLELQDVEIPTSGDDEVLVKVYAASVTYSTLMFIQGEPFVGRLWSGLLKPTITIPGADIAGRIEALGRNVLSETAEALKYYGEGHSRGKVVITVEQNNKT